MKKLRLMVDELAVDGFNVLPAHAARQGTVVGQDAGPTGLACPTNGFEYTCRNGSCYSGSPCSYCP
jgi:hypothetical protein